MPLYCAFGEGFRLLFLAENLRGAKSLASQHRVREIFEFTTASTVKLVASRLNHHGMSLMGRSMGGANGQKWELIKLRAELTVTDHGAFGYQIAGYFAAATGYNTK